MGQTRLTELFNLLRTLFVVDKQDYQKVLEFVNGSLSYTFKHKASLTKTEKIMQLSNIYLISKTYKPRKNFTKVEQTTIPRSYKLMKPGVFVRQPFMPLFELNGEILEEDMSDIESSDYDSIADSVMVNLDIY